MRPAWLEDIDPQAVQGELPGQVECAFLGEGRDMLIEKLDEVGDTRVPNAKVIERGIGSIAAIAVLFRPSASRAVVFGEVETGIR